MIHSPVAWLTDDQWQRLPLLHRAAVLAHVDVDVLQVREAGINRGQAVEGYLRTVGLPGGYPWCAAAYTAWLVRAGWDRSLLPKNPASVCTWQTFGASRAILTRDLRQLVRGDAVLWCDSRKWQGHIGMFIVEQPGGRYSSFEGNTNMVGSREGDGAYRKIRRFDSTRMYGLMMHRLEAAQ